MKIAKSIIIKEIALAISFLLMAIGIFCSLQNPKVYSNTLGLISSNYFRAISDTSLILQSNKIPFQTPTPENLSHYDGKFYETIKNFGYPDSTAVRKSLFAFFPLFPFVWRISTLPITQIGFLNFGLFIFSLIILIGIYTPLKEKRENLILFTCLLLMPFNLLYFMPYSEACFLFVFTLIIYAAVNSYKYLFYLSLILLGTVRPAVSIIIPAILCTEIIFLLKYRSIKYFLKESLLKIIPILSGFFLVMLYQYQFSKKWFLFFEVQQLWDHRFRIPSKLFDWSKEGFSMSFFSLFIIGSLLLLLLIYKIKLLFLEKSEKTDQLSMIDNPVRARDYFIWLSIFYSFGIFAFIIFFQGGSLNSLYRYICASPFFYLLFIHHFYSIFSTKEKRFFALLLLIITIIYSMMPYTRHWDFADSGFIILVLIFVFYTFKAQLPNWLHISTLILLALYSIIWQTYLYNSFISNGWLFT